MKLKPRLTVIVMIKPPFIGRAKTRLAREIGRSEAARFNRMCHAQTFKAIKSTSWAPHIWVGSDGYQTYPTPAIWPYDLKYQIQPKGDLGQKLQKAYADLAIGSFVIIGSDLPVIKKSHFHQALKALLTHEHVIGPSKDGGFWLYGSHKKYREHRLFQNVRWSSAETLDDFSKNLNGRIHYLDMLSDVDDRKSYLSWLQNR